MRPHPCGNALLPVRVCYPRLIFILCMVFKAIMDPPSSDPFDPDLLRLPVEMIGKIAPRRRPPKHRVGQAFLKGPIPWAWWSTACRLPGQALQVASAIRYQTGKSRLPEVRLGLADLEPTLGVGRDSARRGLQALEGAGLIAVSRRVGSKPLVVPLAAPAARTERKPLYGPIPWDWWSRACRLPGRSLQVASALWFLVGWSKGREAEFELGLSEWGALGLSRFSASRGLECLRRSSLVSVVERPGRRPMVTLRDPVG
jgi:hypothetical protein